MKNIRLYLLILSISFISPKFTYLDFLKTDDSQIKNNYGKGNCVYLRGTNIGNLFVQESWMSSTNARDQKTINENLESRFGHIINTGSIKISFGIRKISIVFSFSIKGENSNYSTSFSYKYIKIH